MVEIGIPELNLEQITYLCEGAEKTAREYILSKISKTRIVILEVEVKAVGTKPITIDVDVNIILSPLMKGFNVKTLTKESTNRAFEYIEEYLSELKCKSKKY